MVCGGYDCRSIYISYIGSSIYRRRTAADPWFAVDCRGLRTILRGGEPAGEKKTFDRAVRAFISVYVSVSVDYWK